MKEFFNIKVPIINLNIILGDSQKIKKVAKEKNILKVEIYIMENGTTAGEMAKEIL